MAFPYVSIRNAEGVAFPFSLVYAGLVSIYTTEDTVALETG